MAKDRDDGSDDLTDDIRAAVVEMYAAMGRSGRIPTLTPSAHVFVLRDGAGDWVAIPREVWLAHSEGGFPLAGFAGDIHVATTVASDGAIINIRFRHRLLDSEGRLAAELDALPPEEREEFDRLQVAAEPDAASRRRYEDLCEKEWRAGLPPADKARKLLRHLPLPVVTRTASARMLLTEIGLDPAGWMAGGPGGAAN